MPEQFLDDAQVGTTLEQMSGGAVPESVWPGRRASARLDRA